MINITDNRTFCCSMNCKKRFECARADINNKGTHYVEDYSSFGTGTYSDNGCEIEHWCGENGDYKMFEPIEEKIPFPFQFLEKFLLGEMSLNEALDKTIDEFWKLINEYLEKNSKE